MPKKVSNRTNAQKLMNKPSWNNLKKSASTGNMIKPSTPAPSMYRVAKYMRVEQVSEDNLVSRIMLEVEGIPLSSRDKAEEYIISIVLLIENEMIPNAISEPELLIIILLNKQVKSKSSKSIQ